jgi:hypothetical protein
MTVRSLAPFLALILTTACASASRMPVPNWERYRDGELAGFLYAPREHVVSEVPEIVVQRARGRIASPAADGQRESRLELLRPEPTVRVAENEGYRTPDLAAIDTGVFVVELRGPGTSQRVRTVATRSSTFDFGPLPNGAYTLKATASGSATVPGWFSKIRRVVVSDSADPAAEIRVW